MARWKLMADHYLNVDPVDGESVEWEYKEIDRETGRQRRKTFQVPMHLTKELIVSNVQNNFGDIVFHGDPTLDMMPLDEEAKAISERVNASRPHPIDSLPSNGDFSQSLIRAFEAQMQAVVQRGQGPVSNTSLSGVDPKQFEALQKQVAELMDQNAKLQEASRPAVDDSPIEDDPAPIPAQASVPPTRRQPTTQVARR